MKNKQRELLLKLRSKLVGALHVQPYIIYDDDTIERLLDAQPKTLEELKAVKGFPDTGKRFKGFGIQIVAIFKEPENITNFNVSSSGNVTAIPRRMEI